MSLNSWSATGRCTRDAELKHIGQKGTALAIFNVAIDIPTYKDGKYGTEPLFVKVEMWGQRAETVWEWFTKGSPIAFTGSIKFDTWEGKDGNERQTLVCKASDVQTLETKAQREARSGVSKRGSSDELGDSGSYSGASTPVDDDDIPF